MAGMQDFFASNSDDPKFGANMALFAGMMSGNMPQGLQGYTQALQQGKQEAIRNQQMQMQMELNRMQLEKAKREAGTEMQMADAAKSAYHSPSLATALSTGPMPDGSAVPAVAPGFDMKGYADKLFSIDPIKGLALQQSLAKENPFGKIDPKDYAPDSVRAFAASGGKDFSLLKPRSKVEVGPGGQVYDPYNTAPGTVMADPNKPFAVGPNGLTANGPFQQYEINKAKAGASRVSVNNKQEGEESKAVGKFFGENYADVQKAGFSAQSAMNRLDRLGQLLDGVDTGKFAPLGLEAAKTAQSLGLNIDPKLANKEAAVALSSEIALQLRNPAGGAGMPGAMSDSDRNFLNGMVPGIEKTPQGRKTILETAKKMAQRDVEVARMARNYRQKTGTINEGFYEELARFSEANPLFKGAADGGADIDSLIKKYAR